MKRDKYRKMLTDEACLKAADWLVHFSPTEMVKRVIARNAWYDDYGSEEGKWCYLHAASVGGTICRRLLKEGKLSRRARGVYSL